MFTNIKVAMMDDSDLASGNISLFGLEMSLVSDVYATSGVTCSTCTMDSLCWGCDTGDGALLNFCCKWECGDYSGVLCGHCYDACTVPGEGCC